MLEPGVVKIAPSLLSADYGHLASAAGEVTSVTDWLHLDVMDGHFVPNVTIGPPVVASLRRHSPAFFDCHLMMSNPQQFLKAFAAAGASSVTVHVEIGDTAALVEEIHALGMKAGLACNPDTPLESAEPFLAGVDLLLLMTVFPGFGGQSFMHEVVPKIAAARHLIDERGLRVAIEVDGGIAPGTVELTAAAGARVFVAGSAVFSHERPFDAVVDLQRRAEEAVLAARRD